VTVPWSKEKIRILEQDPEWPFVKNEHNLEKVSPFFKKVDTISQSCSSRVLHVIRKRDNQELAMKITRRDVRRNPIKQEYKLLSMLDHPNILGYRDCYLDREQFYFCTELCKGGDLLKIKEMKFREVDAALFIKTIISAIEYCHSKNVVHRDLKPENIVFRTNAQKELVIIGFGDAKVVELDRIYEDFVC